MECDVYGGGKCDEGKCVAGYVWANESKSCEGKEGTDTLKPGGTKKHIAHKRQERVDLLRCINAY